MSIEIICTIIGTGIAIVVALLAGFNHMLVRREKIGADGNRLNNVEEIVKNLECVNHKTTVRVVESKLADVINTLTNNSNDITNIRSDIHSINNKMVLMTYKIDNINSPLSKSKSPISLTHLGEQASAELKIKDSIAAKWETIQEIINEEAESKNAYDIQQACIKIASLYLEKILSADEIENIKSYAFKNGHPMSYYHLVVGIELRDEYFKKNNINIDDVDVR